MFFQKKEKEQIQDINDLEKATMLLNGGNCPSCAYTIEKVSVKFDGIKECCVDRVNSKIDVLYDKNKPQALEKISSLVQKIGYEAVLYESD